MGTYTTNKNLFMPTVGEQGWGTLVNGNFETIDNFLKPITISGSTYTFTGNHIGNQSGGSVSATSITNSGTLTQTGTSTFTGKVTANGGIGTKALTATSISNSGTLTNTGTSTFTGKITANGGIGTTSLTTSGNITSNGTISATKIKQTGVATVTAGTPSTTDDYGYMGNNTLLFVLPITFYKYTGSVKVCNVGGQSIYYKLGLNGTVKSISYADEGVIKTISFTNVDSVWIWGVSTTMSIGSVTLS